MTDHPKGIEPYDEWSIPTLEATVGIVTTTIGSLFGPIGAITGALLGPLAKHAITRLLELRSRLEDAGINVEEIISRLDEDEALASLVAEVVRGTVESDLAAKRTLLAMAAIKALDDDALVDVEARFVEAAVGTGTVDIRVLAIIDERQDPEESPPFGPGQTTSVATEVIELAWPGVRSITRSVTARLVSTGLIQSYGTGEDGPDFWRLTDFGREFLSRLQRAGLAEDLARRSATVEGRDPDVG